MRRTAGWLLVLVLESLGLVAGVLLALTLTPPGRVLLTRVVSREADALLDGDLEVGGLGGSFLFDLTARRVVLRDSAARVVLEVPELRATYRLPNLLAGRLVLASLSLQSPVIHLARTRAGRWNVEEVLRLGRRPAGGAPPLVQFSEVRVEDGRVELRLPWTPDGRLRTAAQRDSALAAERAKRGRRIEPGPDGLQRVVVLEGLHAHLPELRVSTPRRAPLAFRVAALRGRLSDPQLDLRALRAQAVLEGRTLAFVLERVELPGTVASGRGTLRWPRDTILYDATLRAPRADLADLGFISPLLPPMQGRADLVARSEHGGRVRYRLSDLVLQGRQGGVRGRLVAITDVTTGLAVEDLDLDLRALDLDAIRPFLDTLPFRGTVSGRTRADGDLNALQVDVDWAYLDPDVPAPAPARSLVAARGGVRTGTGLRFERLEVRAADLDGRTVQRLAPAVALRGRLRGAGRLDGPLRDATWTGTLRHRDGELPESVVEGRLHVDTRGRVVAVTSDVELAPLAFDGVRPSYPGLAARGALRGRVRTAGSLEALQLEADVAGELGRVRARGLVGLLAPRWTARPLDATFADLDLAALAGRGPRTRLTGALAAAGVLDRAVAPEGQLTLALQAGWIREFPLDSARVELAVRDGRLRLDTARVHWAEGEAWAGGALGWARDRTGTIAFGARAGSLRALDSVLVALTGVRHDTLPDDRRLEGRGEFRGLVAGRVDSLVAGGSGALRDVRFERWRNDSITVAAAWLGGPAPTVALTLRADSLARAPMRFYGSTLRVAGPLDSLAWALGTRLGNGTRVAAAGRLWPRYATPLAALDTLDLDFRDRGWRLALPMAVALGDSSYAISPLELEATDGSGTLRLAGLVPGPGEGLLAVTLRGLSIADLVALAQADTTGVGGSIDLDLDVRGTARAPTIRGTVALADATVGDAQLPLAVGSVRYAAQRLGADLTLWRTGRPVLTLAGDVPVDLAFVGARKRLVEGPLRIRADADSVDLAFLDALTRTVDGLSGQLRAHVEIGGRWGRPELAGAMDLRDATLTLPGLGVTWRGIAAQADLAGDSLVIHDTRLRGGEGTLAVRGKVRLDSLTAPILDLALDADRFEAIDVRNFLALTASGNLRLRGPVFGARLTGRVRADEGVLYFADLIQKNIVDLDDPANAQLITELGGDPARLRAKFQTRFLDALAVDSLRVLLGERVFLRSTEANVKLASDAAGVGLRVDKRGRTYRFDGTLVAERGDYSLKPLPGVTKDFQVTRGEVRYVGTTDLNAQLDLEAQHLLRTQRGQELRIVARITGSLAAPKLNLTSDANPPVSESDLASYLLYGRPTSEIGQAAGQTVTNLLAGSLASQFERALVSSFGSGLFDTFEIRGLPSLGQSGPSLTQLAIGRQIGRRTFLTLNSGACFGAGAGTGGARFGGSVEYRFTPRFRIQTSFEPASQTCLQAGSDLTLRYQFGADLFWEREF